MPKIDAYIFDTMGETATVGSNEVKGIFYKQYREIVMKDGTIVGLDISFDCRYANVNHLQEGDTIVVEGETYRFQRFVPQGGDESGLVRLELGRPLP